ncbi:hypothetical protein EDB83DRAFT_2349659 [Lactarius deliciosus]|nr:hypothetical protein EDB83DRAFT_2349659 [Lactarius deliciosus]
MSLFTGNLRRSVGAGLVSFFTGTLLMWTLPSNLHVFALAQTSVAILAIGSLMIFVVTHHRRNGQVLTQDQEEMILIGAFGLFWFGKSSSVSGVRVGGRERQFRGMRLRESNSVGGLCFSFPCCMPSALATA